MEPRYDYRKTYPGQLQELEDVPPVNANRWWEMPLVIAFPLLICIGVWHWRGVPLALILIGAGVIWLRARSAWVTILLFIALLIIIPLYVVLMYQGM